METENTPCKITQRLVSTPDVDGIEADFRNGLLKPTISKPAASQSAIRKIEIKAS